MTIASELELLLHNATEAEFAGRVAATIHIPIKIEDARELLGDQFDTFWYTYATYDLMGAADSASATLVGSISEKLDPKHRELFIRGLRAYCRFLIDQPDTDYFEFPQALTFAVELGLTDLASELGTAICEHPNWPLHDYNRFDRSEQGGDSLLYLQIGAKLRENLTTRLLKEAQQITAQIELGTPPDQDFYSKMDDPGSVELTPDQTRRSEYNGDFNNAIGYFTGPWSRLKRGTPKRRLRTAMLGSITKAASSYDLSRNDLAENVLHVLDKVYNRDRYNPE
tara:strand:+ start:736 stop:1581 length:846 start_codon:yes stop_codon:yes gene_type:complete